MIKKKVSTKETEESFAQPPPSGAPRKSEESAGANDIDEVVVGDHPDPKEFDLLLGGGLSGDRLVKALFHLDECSECRRKLPPIKPAALLRAVFGEEKSSADDADCSTTNAEQGLL